MYRLAQIETVVKCVSFGSRVSGNETGGGLVPHRLRAVVRGFVQVGVLLPGLPASEGTVTTTAFCVRNDG